MNAITFRAPQILWFLLAVPLAFVFFLARERRRVAIARRFVSERLRGVANPLRSLRPWLASLTLLGCVIALAGPEAGFRVVPIEQRESNRVIVIDVSLSMDARDVGASRLDAAKAIAKRIIEAQSGRVGLVIFESAAEVVSPLTSDGEAVESLLDSIQAGEVSNPGSDVSTALNAALRLVGGDAGERGDVVLISDGEDQGTKLDDAITRVKQRGVTVSTIMVGTAGGSTIPRSEGGGVLVDDNGQVVTTYARPEALKKIAAATGGTFYANPFGEHDLDSLAATGGAARQRNVQVPIERYQWPLAFAWMALFLGSLANRGAE
jgi:Ca-activated chloride channel homolog